MSRATHLGTDGWVACGLPSPGSRAQGYQGGEHCRPATYESVDVSPDWRKVDCKRCKKSPEYKRARVGA